ncbi:hypothetical protein LTS93_23595 [Escherichia coli]|nr:hypothetical protein [Escherichia coli]MCD6701016.1 hypothetical protein [Escherichia coli]MCE3718454.1 hypothetical protein [Escherichia coli]MCI2820134.1 hypothetical protein [Escherichia coli]MCM2706098.1 hypothetical protein [Escherichia coli]MCN4638698.1 hypothetical protein [Escherichia coli]
MKAPSGAFFLSV